MSRFDCPEYVQAWVDTGAFPAIHDGIFALLESSVPSGASVLDLGSSTGLLSRRMADAGYVVYPMEGSRASSNAGIAAGVYEGMEVFRHRLRPGDLRGLTDWLSRREITVVMARRVFPELDDYGVHPNFLSRAFFEAGIEHIFVEGRLPRPNATHRLRTLDCEIKALGPLWEVESFDGPHRAHLVRAATTATSA